MSLVLEKSVGADGERGLAGLALGLAQAEEPRARQEPHVACFHCGEPCPDLTLKRGDKAFCCGGCLAVHELLTEAGLAQFYELNRHPGTRVRRQVDQKRWSYLDEPSVRERLLDFSDDKTCRVTFHVPAIRCVACVWLLENLFRLHPGIGASQVNFPRREVVITFAAQTISLSHLAGLLASIGYEPRLTLGELERKPVDRSRTRLWLQVGIAGFAFGNTMLFSIPAYLGLDSFSQPLFGVLFGYLSLALALPVLLYSAADYWRSALLSIRERAMTLDVPIALGLAALYTQSAVEILSGRGGGYLDSLTGLVFFLLCGRVFQQKTFDRITFDRDYKCFFPLAVIRRTAAGEGSVAISELEVGDHLLLRNSELIPADCRLLKGEALIDYSFVTGESEPVAKVAGDYLYAGGRQSGSAIEVETVKPVSQSYLTSLWSHETFRKERDNRLTTLTNRYSRRFTQAVIGVALGAALFWVVSGDNSRAVKAFASVLIVACPCALALAAPFALGTAQRLLAQRKVFLKNPLVLERMAEVDAIVFDKTGTLTSGAAYRTEFHPVDGPLSDQARDAVWSLARQSTHPSSARICGAFSPATERPVIGFVEAPGSGICATVAGMEIRVGSRAWLEQSGITIPDLPVASRGGSWVAIDGRVRGFFAFSAALRPNTGPMVDDLGRHCELALLSGDNERDEQDFRRLFGPDARLCFNQSPLDKLEFIKKLQTSGRTVMMVGDGLNDAGALKQSDIGVAVVERIGTFSPASDIILEAAQVPELGKILEWGRRSARTVRLSFAVSAIYNLAGVGIAASGVLSPVICAVLMPLSSISVVLFACGAVKLAGKRIHSSGDLAASSAFRPQPATVQ